MKTKINFLSILLLRFSPLVRRARRLSRRSTQTTPAWIISRMYRGGQRHSGAGHDRIHHPWRGTAHDHGVERSPNILETVIIDGGNGGVATDRVELSGAGAFGSGLIFNTASADSSEVRNLVINGFTSRQILFINTSATKSPVASSA